MKIVLLVLIVLLVISAFWITALYAEKKNLLKDDNDNYIPDVIEDKVNNIKDSVAEKIDNTKQKIKNVKKAIKK